VIRPSYVLGGRAMEIVHDTDEVNRYVTRLSATLDRPSELTVSDRQPLLIDRYLTGATEVDVDCLSDGEDTFIAGVMEHIEEAGIHSGDSACALPPHSLSAETIAELEAQASQLAKALGVVGLMNIQFAIKNGEIYILEVNPRASRTVPFVAKVVGLPVAGIAAEIMSGRKLASFALTAHNIQHIAVKEAVFPFARFPGVDPVLGPEMRSTGEVMGIDTISRLPSPRARSAGHPCHSLAALSFPFATRTRRASCRPSAAWPMLDLTSSQPAAPSAISLKTALTPRRSTRCSRAARISSTPSRMVMFSSSSTPPRVPRRLSRQPLAAAALHCSTKCPITPRLPVLRPPLAVSRPCVRAALWSSPCRTTSKAGEAPSPHFPIHNANYMGAD
jgi:hypothetical protein